MNCLKGSFRGLEVVKNVKMIERMPWLPLYRVRGLACIKKNVLPTEGSLA
jgi:hypothetical protein